MLFRSISLISDNIAIYSTYKTVVNIYPNTALITMHGDCTIQVLGSHPAKYLITRPDIVISGLMYGLRTFKYTGRYTIEDTNNKIYSVIAMNPIKQGIMAKLFSKKEHRDDYVRGFITDNEDIIDDYDDVIYGKGHLATCEGNWIDKFCINNEVVWEIDKVEPGILERPMNRLLSDSSQRLDVKAMKEGDLKEAQRIRVMLKSKQKNDKKLREQNSQVVA